VDGDYMALSYAEYDVCIQPASKAMEISLMNASNFFSDLPQNTVGDDGYPILLGDSQVQNKHQYEGALRNFYSEIETLKACQPFCNVDNIFVLPEK
jgi:hypothetical protein